MNNETNSITDNTQREIIYAELDDELMTLVERVKRTHPRNVVLVVPVKAQILQSLVNLKILRMKSENAGKAITLVTKDIIGLTLAHEAGFVTAERVSIKGKHVELFATQTPEPSTPPRQKLGRYKLSLVASKDSPNNATRILTPDDIPLAYTNPISGIKKLFLRLAGGVLEEFDEKTEEIKFIVKAPSRSLLFSLISVAVLLVFFITYIAVPSATVYVTPRADAIDRTINMILIPNIPTGPNNTTRFVSADFLDLKFSHVVRIGATGEIFRGTNANGVITLFNRSPKEKFLVPSRLRSTEGIMFRTLSAVTIPRASGDTPGQIDVPVIACERDDSKCDCIKATKTCRGKFIGERGNLAPTQFIFPAIPSLSPSLYWGESKTKFTGGITKITRYISAEDLANIEETLVSEATKIAREKLIKMLAEKNQLENRNLTLLDDPKVLLTEIISFEVPPKLKDQQQDSFAVPITLRVRAIAYEENKFRAVLAEQLKLKVHPEKILREIDFEHVAILIEEVDLKNKQIKIATTIQGIEEYDLSAETVAGARFTEKIRTRIFGQTIEDAESYIRNLPEVNNSSISSWPFWARTVPELPENVKFVIQSNSD